MGAAVYFSHHHSQGLVLLDPHETKDAYQMWLVDGGLEDGMRGLRLMYFDV
jgi:hypothetical protein